MISTGDRPRSLAVLLAAVLVGSLVAPAAFAGSTAAAPAGMASIPDANVAEEVPAGESIPLDAADLQAGRVMASDHADSLDVILTTPERAATIMGTDSAAISGNGMAVVLRDDEHSDGRRVALDAGRLQDALGYQPEAIYGTHEDGSEWTATAEYVDGYLVFDVPHFSSNTVTFSGEVTIDATSATNATQFQYQVANASSVANSELTLTGSKNTQCSNISTSKSNGESIDPQIGGNIDPKGPFGSPTISLSYNPNRYNPVDAEGDGDRDNQLDKFVGDNANNGKWKTAATIIPNKTGELQKIIVPINKVTGSDPGSEINVYLSSGKSDDTYKDGTHLKSWDPTWTTGTQTIDLSTTPTVSEDTRYHIDFITKSSNGDGTADTLGIETSNNGWGVSLVHDKSDGFPANIKQWADIKIAIGETQLEDPAVDVDGDGTNEISYDGNLTGEITRDIDLEAGGSNWTISTKRGSVEISAAIKEQTITTDPSITISSDAGSQTVDYSGTLSDGSTTDLSNEIDNSKIGGETTVTATVDDPASGPAGQVALNYSHSAQDQISTHYEASTFEELYNISHTYADATKNAQATIPFASSRVAGVKNVEYRVDGGSWNRVASTNYRFEGTTLDVYLDDATGGVQAGQTVDVRATGRKVTVDNGQVTITDPTRPGDDLDTQLQIDSRSDDFALNVGPTANGRRVHYATSNDYPTEDYVVIQANGDQDLHLPDSRAGDTFRVQHLKTKVEPKQGDVRIDVLKAGSNPELDVSPGPGGAGDPVDFKYYRTESGAEYILKSLTDSIVRDSDVAQSPAIFEDDDSDETLAITLDSVASTASQTGGAVGGAVAGAGQFAADQATGLLGMISLPIGGSPILWLLGIVGLGFVVFRTDLLSGSGDGLDDAGDAAGGLTRTAGRAVSGAGSGILAGLRGLLGYLGEIAAVILSNRRATIVATILLAISLSAAGVISITEDVAILLVLAGIPIASYIGLRSNGLFSQRVWLASTAIATLVGVELVAPGTLQIAIEQLTSEAVAPLLILLVGGAAYLYYRTRQAEASTPGTVIRTVIGNDDGND